MKALLIYQVDAFTSVCFKGNPAGICFLEEEIDDSYMQLIAREMNLSETAFLLHLKDNIFKLRWFTPKTEVPLCGHATLGASKVMFEEFNIKSDNIIYETNSGRLKAKKHKDGITLDFPLDEPISIQPPAEIIKAMGITNYENVIYGRNTSKLVIHLKTEDDVKKLNPDFEQMRQIQSSKIKGAGVTCRGNNNYDFISRYFNPWAGVNEDPVTGSVHTLLASYWGDILNKTEMKAYQASQRGGEILLKVENQDRVGLTGDAVIVSKGEIFIPDNNYYI